MHFMIITGPQAVGKMAVGMEIGKLTGLRLFHNHMTIELALKLFDYHTPEAQRLIRLFREEIFNAMAASNQKGMIFTYVWDFENPDEYAYINKLIALFEAHGATTSIVELESDLAIRIERNKTPLRLAEKASKRNLEWSEGELISSMERYRLNSKPGEIGHANYLRIDNGGLSAEAVALMVVEYFKGLLD